MFYNFLPSKLKEFGELGTDAATRFIKNYTYDYYKEIARTNYTIEDKRKIMSIANKLGEQNFKDLQKNYISKFQELENPNNDEDLFYSETYNKWNDLAKDLIERSDREQNAFMRLAKNFSSVETSWFKDCYDKICADKQNTLNKLEGFKKSISGCDNSDKLLDLYADARKKIKKFKKSAEVFTNVYLKHILGQKAKTENDIGLLKPIEILKFYFFKITVTQTDENNKKTKGLINKLCKNTQNHFLNLMKQRQKEIEEAKNESKQKES